MKLTSNYTRVSSPTPPANQEPLISSAVGREIATITVTLRGDSFLTDRKRFYPLLEKLITPTLIRIKDKLNKGLTITITNPEEHFDEPDDVIPVLKFCQRLCFTHIPEFRDRWFLRHTAFNAFDFFKLPSAPEVDWRPDGIIPEDFYA
jgi:hypothetical protein